MTTRIKIDANADATSWRVKIPVGDRHPADNSILFYVARAKEQVLADVENLWGSSADNFTFKLEWSTQDAEVYCVCNVDDSRLINRDVFDRVRSAGLKHLNALRSEYEQHVEMASVANTTKR